MFKVQNKDINIHPYGSSHPKMFREKCVENEKFHESSE